MPQRSRIGIGLVTLTILATLAVVPVAAGNFAEVQVTSGLDAPPTAGEERELGLVLLQHGITPVDHGQVLVTAVLPGTGETLTAQAVPLGDGAWTATIAFPTAGDWQVRVTHSEFETPEPMVVGVAEATAPIAMLAIPIAVAALALLLVAAAATLVRRPRRATAASPVEPSLPGG
jgi:hypothetical protein